MPHAASLSLQAVSEPRAALARAFGCARVVYNDCMAARREAHRAGAKYPLSTGLQRRLITEAKHTPERAWLAEVSNIVLQQAVHDCLPVVAVSRSPAARAGECIADVAR